MIALQLFSLIFFSIGLIFVWATKFDGGWGRYASRASLSSRVFHSSYLIPIIYLILKNV